VSILSYLLIAGLQDQRLDLIVDEDRNRNEQWCHRCYHHPQQCSNPGHGFFGTDRLNKSMHKCANGAAFYCPHQPVCLFMDPNGIAIPCRALLTFPVAPCPHNPNCHINLPGRRAVVLPAPPPAVALPIEDLDSDGSDFSSPEGSSSESN